MLTLRSLKRVGFDRVILYTIAGRTWAILTGPLTLLLIAHFLTGAEQGFYYSFGSVLGLQALFELGLAFVLFQFASHERAKLSWSPEGLLTGDPQAMERLFSLLRKALVWYSTLAVVVFIFMSFGGLEFFGSDASDKGLVVWKIAWIWAVVCTSADLVASPIVAIIEGSGLVTEVALIRSLQIVIGTCGTWLILVCHGRLLAAPISNTAVVVGWWIWLLCTKRAFLKQLWTYVPKGIGIDWRQEVWPFQWKIALSGSSSYFIYLIFTPILFRFQGSTVAGQMGMTMAAFGAVGTIGAAWVSTKMSPFGVLIAKRDFAELDNLFFPALRQSLGVVVALGVALWLAFDFIYLKHYPISQRFLPPVPMLFFLGTTVVNHVVGVEALYLRAHKQDPFLVLSVVMAILTAITTYILAKYFSITSVMACNFSLTLAFSLGWGSAIFVAKRRVWHCEIPKI